MVKILNTRQSDFKTKFVNLLKKRDKDDEKIDKIVSKIIYDVRKNSDNALIRLTNELDKSSFKKVQDLIVKNSEFEKCFQELTSSTKISLMKAIRRIKSYHKKQMPKNTMYKDKEGVTLGGIWNPMESVGLYVPGGKAAYPSSLIMNAVPAIVAGVKRIVVTVPAVNGEINPLVLACCKILGIKEVYKIGGAQAISALAMGTKTIQKVDKIMTNDRYWKVYSENYYYECK